MTLHSIYRACLGFAAALTFFAVGCDSGSTAPDATQSSGGRLVITSTPAGATVQILGKTVDVTPKTTKPVPPGMYIIKISKDGYEPMWKPAYVSSGKDALVDVKLKALTSIVMLTSKPSGAKVEKNGKQIGVTPMALTNLPMGNHSVLFTHSGYSPMEKAWRLENDRPIAIHAELSSNTGTLTIDSDKEASVFIDDEPHGVTPYRGVLESGQHKVRLEKYGYETYTAIVEVKRSETMNLSVSPKIRPMELSIKSKPNGAIVFVNGKECGTTPCIYRTSVPGKYTVSAIKEKYSKSNLTIEMTPGNPRDVMLTLESELGSIQLVTLPAGVTVYIDKKEIGKTEQDPTNPNLSKVFLIQDILNGEHEVEIVHKRGKPTSKTIKVKVVKGKTNRIRKPLELWVPNVILELNNNIRPTGRVMDLKADPIILETAPRVKISYPLSEIRNIEIIKDGE